LALAVPIWAADGGTTPPPDPQARLQPPGGSPSAEWRVQPPGGAPEAGLFELVKLWLQAYLG
jgi:hypothetical protein